MGRLVKPSHVCPEHGMPRDRANCRGCNAAYMRMYLWRRRQQQPDRELWRRARKRAAQFGIAFTIPEATIIIPPACPVLGIPLRWGGERSPYSPSLDRIIPALGYVPGNVRVISDRANRLKGARTMYQVRACERAASGPLRSEYRLIAEYLERESLLREVRLRASEPGWSATEWNKIADFLDQVFSRGTLVDDKHSVS